MHPPSRAPATRKRTRAILLLVAVTPGLWWQPPTPAGDRTGNLTIAPLPITAKQGNPYVQVAGTWLLESDDRRFVGYSALVVGAGGRLRAYSDSSRWLEFDAPDRPSSRVPEFGSVPGYEAIGHNDLESATRDPASGLTWLGFEHLNSLRRIGPGAEQIASTKPPAMADFRLNGGAESLVRLPDGRFVVIAESAHWPYPLRRTGLLFARDPVADARAARFVFVPPLAFNPTDAAALPDGRVLILIRGLSLGRWPPFRSKLLIADAADIRPGQVWEWQELADLSGLVPPENYEGLAVERRGPGFVLWLIADANRSAVLQRTLLVKLVWDGRSPGSPAKARLRRPVRPS
jgi:hypothetical protein